MTGPPDINPGTPVDHFTRRDFLKLTGFLPLSIAAPKFMPFLDEPLQSDCRVTYEFQSTPLGQMALFTLPEYITSPMGLAEIKSRIAKNIINNNPDKYESSDAQNQLTWAFNDDAFLNNNKDFLPQAEYSQWDSLSPLQPHQFRVQVINDQAVLATKSARGNDYSHEFKEKTDLKQYLDLEILRRAVEQSLICQPAESILPPDGQIFPEQAATQKPDIQQQIEDLSQSTVKIDSNFWVYVCGWTSIVGGLFGYAALNGRSGGR